MNTRQIKGGFNPQASASVWQVCRLGVAASLVALAFSAQAQFADAVATSVASGAGKSSVAGQTQAKEGKPAGAAAAKSVGERGAVKTVVASSQSVSGLSCAGDLPAPVALNVSIGKSTLLKLPAPIVRRTLGDEGVVQAKQLGPQTIYLLGISVGSTNMILQDKAGKCSLVDVDVGIDAGGLQAKLKQIMPNEKSITVTAAAGTLMLSGAVSDAYKAERAMSIATAYAGKGDQAQKVINMMTVAAPQQVMLEVQVAEVSKTLLDKLSGGVGLSNTHGNWNYGLLSSYLTGIKPGVSALTRKGNTTLGLEAEKKDGLIKILAEPTIMAISGQEGAFLAGGKIFIPVSSTNQNGILSVGLEEREFGVGLKFTPTVLEGGLINLRVAPEVSELSPEGVGISAAGSATPSILPVITTRRASTTVQLYDGQSFAVGGLIKNNVTQNVAAFPILGEIPVLGALFRSSAFQTDKSELVIIVTPRLVKPLPADYKLPTDSFVEPSRSEFFLEGKMEGAARQSSGNSVEGSSSAHSAAQAPSGFEVR